MERAELFEFLEDNKQYHQPYPDNRQDLDPVYQEMVSNVTEALLESPSDQRKDLLERVYQSLHSGPVPTFTFNQEDLKIFTKDILLRILEQTYQPK